MMNIGLNIAYDGTNYKGWQRQDRARTIQEEVERAIYLALDQRVKLIAAGRTDAGVHAYRQVANFHVKDLPAPNKAHFKINAKLAKDIRILKSYQVPASFHSRFDATGKVYQYKIYNARYMHPIYRNHYQQVYQNLDIDILKKASQFFLGRHDFSAFSAGLATGTNPVRTIDRIDISQEGPVIALEFEAESFIRNQIRIITGTLVQIARYRIGLDELAGIFESRDRSLAGPTLTGSGLYLVEVKY